MPEPRRAGDAMLLAAARLHHDLFTGLVLALVGEHGRDVAADLVYRTFRRQHDEKFLPGLRTLGLDALPHPVACARFLYLANLAGGVEVQCMVENDRKAWVRYPPPRWAYEGPAICAVGDEVTLAFLRGFHARCGASLGNPRLAFVCTAMTTRGDPGLAGYFLEESEPLGRRRRLRFAFGEAPPPFDRGAAPALPWGRERAAVARRNYAVQYVRVMIPALLEVLGREAGAESGRRAARLIGMQAYRDTAATLGISPGGARNLFTCVAALLEGTGVEVLGADAPAGAIRIGPHRIGDDPAVLSVWNGLLEGAAAVHDPGLGVAFEAPDRYRIG